MKNKKLSFFIVSLLIALQLLTLGTSAEISESAPTKQATADSEYVNWAYSASSDMLIGGTTEYYRYERDYLLTVDPDTVYVYENGIMISGMENTPMDDVYATIQATSPGSDIVWAYHDVADRTEIFATKEGTRLLDELLDASTPPNMRLDKGTNNSSWLDSDTIHMLSGLNITQDVLNIEVTRLTKEHQYTLYSFDASKACRYIQGYIFNYAGYLYYVDYASLGNNNFDADGNLSFRSGTVNMVKLSGELSSAMYQAIDDLEYRYVDYTYEYTEIMFSGGNDSEFSLGIFVFFYSILGFVIPAALAVMGLCLAGSRKLGRPRYWLILSGIAVVWILTAAGLLVILLL